MGCSKVILGNGNPREYCKFPLPFSPIYLSGSKTKCSLRHCIFQWMNLFLFWQAVMAHSKFSEQKCGCLCFFFFFYVILFQDQGVEFFLIIFPPLLQRYVLLS